MVSRDRQSSQDFTYQRLPARLALRFLDSSNYGCSIQGASHQALSELLDTYGKTVSALLRRVRDAGLPKWGHRRIELRDATAMHITISDLPELQDGQAKRVVEDEGIRR